MGITGTTYEKKKKDNSGNSGESKDIIHKRYCKCPICHNKVYNNSENFQELLKEELRKKKSGDSGKRRK